jgi:hypothetical protein
MKQVLLISFLMFFTSYAFCQDSYVTLEGKTIYGKIENYREWSKNPSAVVFKDSAGGNTITLTPENCKKFSAGTDEFVSYHGTRILNSDNIVSSQGLQSNHMVKDTINVFLRKIYGFNNYAVYKLFDNKRINFYFSDNGDIKELEFYESLVRNTAVPFYGYKVFLANKFSDDQIEGLRHKIDVLPYKENELINFFADIFNDKLHASEKLRNKYPSEMLVGIGGNQNFGTLEDIYGRYTFKQTSFSPSFEIALRLYSQRNFGKLFFQPSVSVMPLSNTFNNEVFKVKTTVMNINLGAGYMFVKKPDFSFYAEAAGSLPVLFNFDTRKGASNKFVGTNGPDDRITVHPELGMIIKRTLNISIHGMLPIRLPFTADQEYAYKVSQASVALRYVFISGKK